MLLGKTIVVPSYSLKYVVPDLKKTYIKHHDQELNKPQIAESWNKKLSGGFHQKISDLKNYGLLEGEREKYKLTSLAISYFQTNDVKLLERAVRNIEFWKYLSDKYNKTPTQENFIQELVTVAKLDEAKAKIKADESFPTYIDDIKYSTSGSITEIPSITPPPTPVISQTQIKPGEPQHHHDQATPKPRLILHHKIPANSEGKDLIKMSESNEPKPHMELTSQLNPQKSEPKLELIIRVHGVDNLVVDEDDCRLVEYLVAKIRKNWDTKT